MEVVLLYGACSAAESLGRILFTPVATGGRSEGDVAKEEDNDSCSSLSAIGIEVNANGDATVETTTRANTSAKKATIEVDDASVVPVCEDAHSYDSPWGRLKARRRSPQKNPHPPLSMIDTIVIPSHSASSSTASTSSSTIFGSADSSTSGSIHESVADSLQHTARRPSAPSIEVTLCTGRSPQSSSYGGLPTHSLSSSSFCSSSSSVVYLSSPLSSSQDAHPRHKMSTQTNSRFLGRTSRIRRVRELLKEDVGHRQRRKEKLLDRERCEKDGRKSSRHQSRKAIPGQQNGSASR